MSNDTQHHETGKEEHNHLWQTSKEQYVIFAEITLLKVWQNYTYTCKVWQKLIVLNIFCTVHSYVVYFYVNNMHMLHGMVLYCVYKCITARKGIIF